MSSEGILLGTLHTQCRVVINILFPGLLLLGDCLRNGYHVSFASLPLLCMAHVGTHRHKPKTPSLEALRASRAPLSDEGHMKGPPRAWSSCTSLTGEPGASDLEGSTESSGL